jgi:hypothetical protein
MASDPDRPLSAQVILSDPGAARALAEHFAAAGLEAGPLVGNSFSISGPPEDFEGVFGATGYAAARGEEAAELPLEGLPDELSASVAAVVVSGPPDFGPANP